mmetsp:Transcript_1320/g.3217  ORF Transcript_1320/g.3217 Transcript_1320/m.3217 type:complete len:215 (-) Transcript_1320:178-822(-)
MCSFRQFFTKSAASLRAHSGKVASSKILMAMPAAVEAMPLKAAAVRAYSSIDSTKLAERTERLLAAKGQSGLSYEDLASSLGVTNTYAAQLLLGQARLSKEGAAKLQEAMPQLSAEDLEAMQNEYPMRSYDDAILKEPNVYRTFEAITHYGESIKSIINEQCGDGIMSAIDFYCDVGTTTGKHGEKRVVITFNGKFLPFIEQSADDNGAKSPRS